MNLEHLSRCLVADFIPAHNGEYPSADQLQSLIKQSTSIDIDIAQAMQLLDFVRSARRKSLNHD